jgi:F0F1-type ATP synthase, beta subunit
VGPVVDVHFTLEGGGDLPRIHEALTVKRENGRTLVIEVQQHIGEDTVRCVAMDSTDGLSRGMAASATGNPIAMPVGAQIRGRVMNVVGDTIDGMGSSPATRRFRSTARLRSSRTSRLRRKSFSRASRSSTCWSPISRAERSACSAAPAWARPS